jgi:hypothetical protein
VQLPADEGGLLYFLSTQSWVVPKGIREVARDKECNWFGIVFAKGAIISS